MKLTQRQWLGILILGLVGQLAWLIENMYLNLFVYHTISSDPKVIAAMVAASAITATLTTIFIGALSDKWGKRKPFMVYGYIIWGLTIIGFMFIKIDWIEPIVGPGLAVLVTSSLVVLWDCVMTFFGSSANDAAFNAWITDITTPDNRGKVESVLSILPLLALMIIFGGFDFLTQTGQWSLFFGIFGVFVIAGGLLAKVLIEEVPLQRQSANFKETLQVIHPRFLKKNRLLLWTLVFLLILSTATQVWMPYLLIYIQNFLGITDYTVLFVVVLISASIFSLIGGHMMDRFNKLTLVPLALILAMIGLVGMYLVREPWLVMIFGSLMMGGNMILTSIGHGLFRDHTPLDQAGRYQGVRMVFGVMLPMVIGPFIGSMVIKNTNLTYVDLGVVKQVPTPLIFLVAGILLLLVVFPYVQLNRLENKNV